MAISRSTLRWILTPLALCVVGNSSSGIIEAPAVGTPTVNMGMRQQGRLMAPSVFSCPEEPQAVAEALRRALAFGRRGLWDAELCLHGTGGASEIILEGLRSVDLDGILFKRFHDGP